LAEIYDEQRRSLAAKVGGVGLRIVRDWVVRFKAEGPDGLLDRKASGPTRKLNDARLRALVDLVLRGAIPAVDGVVRWRLKDLVAWIHGEFGLSLDETTVGQKTKITRRWAKRGTRPRAPKNQRTKSA
jgi:transposase